MPRLRQRDFESNEDWAYHNEELVCSSCVREPFLSRYIQRTGKLAACDYCLSTSEDTVDRCLALKDLLDVIRDGISWAYEPAAQYLGNGGDDDVDSWYTPTWDTSDLILKKIGFEARGSVLEDLIQALPSQLWARKLNQDSLGRALSWGWDNFVQKVKYETRYLFADQDSEDRGGAYLDVHGRSPELVSDASKSRGRVPAPTDHRFNIKRNSRGDIPAHEMLDAIGRCFDGLELVRSIKAGTTIYRVRVAQKGKETVHPCPRDLGPPSKEHAKQPNRMSPAGIVMFYGALDRETALAETFEPGNGSESAEIWLARFECLRNLHLLDLTNLPRLPSIFDSERRDLSDTIEFLHAFVDTLRRPIVRNDREHIDYVPTQIVTEYIRHRFRASNHRRLDGILYPSAKRVLGQACVLFVNGANCGAPLHLAEELMRGNIEQVLRLCDHPEVLDGAKSHEWIPRDAV